MKKVELKNKDGVVFGSTTLADPTDWIAKHFDPNNKDGITCTITDGVMDGPALKSSAINKVQNKCGLTDDEVRVLFGG